jgi:hypothetical protein
MRTNRCHDDLMAATGVFSPIGSGFSRRAHAAHGAGTGDHGLA